MASATTGPHAAQRSRNRWSSWRTLARVLFLGLAAAVWIYGSWSISARAADGPPHPALADAPQRTNTLQGFPGDPINVAFVGTQDDLQRMMHAARWVPADPITLRNSLRIAVDTVAHRQYADAPISNLMLWGRKQDLSFEQPVGNSPKSRHHVRFWRSPAVDAQGRPLWLGAAIFDTGVGVSQINGHVTHHIDPDVDAERDKLAEDANQVGSLADIFWIDGFQETLAGSNGGGDPYRTDGRLLVGTIRAAP
ncbi:MAG TPA: LssY C-terminal domain-containing protein [Pirellulales bacterium]|nr:LssY C-terminal domain-containing protein [Pirellulales bacterium]